jgi:hypothetical protein
MSRSARTVTTALLCVVFLGAVGFALVSIPTASAVPEPVTVNLDFDTFVPGVVQTRSTQMQVPVQSTVRRAGVLQSTGDAAAIDWTFELCRDGACGALEEGADVESGDYQLQVSAVLARDVEPVGQGSVAGQFQLVETDSPTPMPSTAVLALAAIGVTGVVLVALTTRGSRRRSRGHGRELGAPA